ncbi:hypothetical protein B7G54_24370 [Burkholderia puraquae]|uniref:MarR family transcriptional regulator n=1 Tax=Burkholderia puraquae TaxID=1904757 RepID=A0A1X1PCR4_9BURK|nr:hypothetical protein [Burkholderia puraquae]ORT83456.1 hypothetical protein B7G54_24370 [Burkholderia puraquae]CAB3762867.1 hypothetical protein LMG29660_04596 [Burkholderia puraquae]
MKMRSRIDLESSSLAQLSPLEQAFLTEVSQSGASDAAFKLALLAVPLLSFTVWRPLSIGDLADRVGLSTRQAMLAARELVEIGALGRRPGGYLGCKLQSYRLRERFRAIKLSASLGQERDARSADSF